ncbi:hypothetical protein M885DRAFT_171363 [Pelagophyceae sp. CCMP2097]|nr:hypothetical protein M885DRAFT_171363 [Pelagophyceae sp. CCMP2097]
MEEAFLVPVSRKAGLVRRPLPDLPGRPAAADAQHALAVGAPCVATTAVVDADGSRRRRTSAPQRYAPRAAKHRAPEPPRARNDDVAPPPAARRDDDDDEKPHRRLHVASARTTARRASLCLPSGARPAASEGATAERVVSGGEHGFLQCDAEDVWFPHAALYVDRLRTRATWRERGGTLDLADWRLEDADLACVPKEGPPQRKTQRSDRRHFVKGCRTPRGPFSAGSSRPSAPRSPR